MKNSNQETRRRIHRAEEGLPGLTQYDDPVPVVIPILITGMCYVPAFRMAMAEDRLDFKTMYYTEGGDRIKIWEPGILLERDLSLKSRQRRPATSSPGLPRPGASQVRPR
ncbi:MAG: hypothetical protein U1F77_06000 [Kiritimatiellia bacterium]